MTAPSSPAERPSLTHLPALDGLRGVAVLGVLLFHDGRLRGGYLGVDLFFVLSGYLITALLITEHRARGGVALGAFWERRARRLLPALLALLPGVALYTALLAQPTELARIRGDGLATLFYYANWRTIFAGKSYWDLFNAPSPFEHAWSLAIEGQFYVVWPLAVLATLRRSRGTLAPLVGLSVALAVASGALMVVLFDPVRSARAYMGTDTRASALLLGAGLAALLAHREGVRASAGGAAAPRPLPGRAWAADAAGVLALGGLGVAWVALDGQDPFLYRGGFWLCQAAALALVVCAAQGQRSLVARALDQAPLRAAGAVSYGLYLWHWPVFCALTTARTGWQGWPLTAARLAVTLAFTLASYRFLETPIRRRGLGFGHPGWVIPGATAVAVGALWVATRGAVAAPAGTASPAGTPASAAASAELRALPSRAELPPGTLRLLVVGDSVALALGETLRAVAATSGAAVAVRASGDCSALDAQHPTRSLSGVRHEGGDCDARWAADAAELAPDVTLVVLGGAYFASVELEGTWRGACEPAWHAALHAELLRNVRAVAAAGGAVTLARVPYPVAAWAKPRWDAGTDCYNALVAEVAAAVPGVRVLALKEQLCPGADHRSCTLESVGAAVRPDGMHFAGAGAEPTARWVLQALRAPAPGYQ